MLALDRKTERRVEYGYAQVRYWRSQIACQCLWGCGGSGLKRSRVDNCWRWSDYQRRRSRRADADRLNTSEELCRFTLYSMPLSLAVPGPLAACSMWVNDRSIYSWKEEIHVLKPNRYDDVVNLAWGPVAHRHRAVEAATGIRISPIR
jgi:hypothetical protein